MYPWMGEVVGRHKVKTTRLTGAVVLWDAISTDSIYGYIQLLSIGHDRVLIALSSDGIYITSRRSVLVSSGWPEGDKTSMTEWVIGEAQEDNIISYISWDRKGV